MILNRLLLRCASLVLSIIGSILEFSHRRAELLDKYQLKCKKLFDRFLKTEDAKLEKHYFYLSHLYRSLLTIMARATVIELSAAQGALKVGILYFVYAKTLNEALLLLARFAGQSGGAELITEEDLYLLIIKVFEGYSYSPHTLRNLYVALCNFATNDPFVDRIGKMKVFHYGLIHAQNNWKNPELLVLIFRFIKYVLRNGQMNELFYEACIELLSSMDFSLPQLAVRVGKELREKSSPALVEILTVLGLACRNNRKFEVSITADKEFVTLIRDLTNEQEQGPSDDMIDAIASLPIEDILIS